MTRTKWAAQELGAIALWVNGLSVSAGCGAPPMDVDRTAVNEVARLELRLRRALDEHVEPCSIALVVGRPPVLTTCNADDTAALRSVNWAPYGDDGDLQPPSVQAHFVAYWIVESAQRDPEVVGVCSEHGEAPRLFRATILPP